eukprot:2933249-Rhodomonas_salina.1
MAFGVRVDLCVSAMTFGVRALTCGVGGAVHEYEIPCSGNGFWRARVDLRGGGCGAGVRGAHRGQGQRA